MKLFSIKLALLLLVLGASSVVFAEEEGFFGKDYDMNVFNPRKVEQETNPIVAPNPNQQEVPSTAEGQASPQTPTITPPPGGRYQVSWLGMIINANDQDHFFTEINSFLEFAIEHDYDLGPIYAVGKDFSSPAMNKVTALVDGRGGGLFFSAEPPAEYQVSKSPAWIIGTKDGQYLIEGVTNFQKYFNSSGELIVKSDS